MKHFSDLVRDELESTGWSRQGERYTKRLPNRALAGQLSDGSRVEILTISENGRWLQRVDGWQTKSLDLRPWYGTDKAGQAIQAALAL